MGSSDTTWILSRRRYASCSSENGNELWHEFTVGLGAELRQCGVSSDAKVPDCLKMDTKVVVGRQVQDGFEALY